MSEVIDRSRVGRELRATLVLALPLVAGQLCAVGMNVVDTVLAGHLGPQTLGAVAIGTAIWSMVILVAIGLMLAVPPSVAQLVGAGRKHEVGPLYRQALWLAALTGVLLTLGVQASPRLLAAANIDPSLIPEAVAFLSVLAFGAPAQCIFFVSRGMSEGLGLTRPTLWFSALGVVLLAPLGYVFMYGRLGLPAMGARGLGMAYAITLWLQAAALIVYLARHRNYRELELFRHFEGPRWQPIAALLSIGVPMGFAIIMEGGLFVATALLIGSLGANVVAAHQVAINVASVAFMIPLGIAMAITVRVGQAVGREDVAGVRLAGFTGIGLVLATQTVSALVLTFAAAQIASVYTRDAAVVAAAVNLLFFAAIFQFSDGIQAASNGALRGLKDTRVPALLTAFAYWIVGMPVGWWLAFRHGMGAPGLWLGLIAGLTVAALMLLSRFALIARAASWRRLSHDAPV
jgi:MATE family multidrug resistance protein